jgi:hypothetical protein
VIVLPDLCVFDIFGTQNFHMNHGKNIKNSLILYKKNVRNKNNSSIPKRPWFRFCDCVLLIIHVHDGDAGRERLVLMMAHSLQTARVDCTTIIWPQ